jgi:probable F420-dependent oxidoreductase
MTRASRVGLWTGALDFTPAALAQEIVAELDEQDWPCLWFGEAYGREAFTAAQLYLSASRRLTVGTGIANIYGRDAVAAAGAARTLEALHPGRFVLGLGVSHAPLVERLRGGDYGRPLAAMRSYLDALAAVRAGVPGETEMPPVVLAALGPKMLELARERTAGAHPYLTTPEHTAQAKAILGEDRMLVVEQAAVIDPAADGDAWAERAHAHLNIYTGLPNYRNSWLRLGFQEEDLVRGGSPRLARALVPHGLEATLERIDEHLQAGATTVLVQVLGANLAQAPRADWARLAEALLP